jgi:hypothetical protein
MDVAHWIASVFVGVPPLNIRQKVILLSIIDDETTLRVALLCGAAKEYFKDPV